jgi:PAS domain S-box-containing protein
MRLYYRIILLVIVMVTLCGVLSTVLSGRLMSQILDKELREKLFVISHIEAESMAHNLLSFEALEARESLIDLVKFEDDIVYAYVVGFDGEIFAHSFEEGFPKDLLSPNVVASHHAEFESNRYMFGEIPVTEMMFPLIEGMDAHIHIGMDETETFKQIKTLNVNILAITSMVATIGILIGLLLSRRISRPIVQLTESISAFGKGRLEEEIKISGGGSEVTELTNAFNLMFTERSRMYEALRESEQNLAITLFSIGDALIATDNEGRVVRMNYVAERLTGWTMKEAAGKDILKVFNIINGMTREPADSPVKKVLKEGEVVGLANHTVLISRDGTQYQIADSAAPISGSVKGVVLVFRDVTEEYRLQQALRESEQNLAITLFSIGDALMATDTEGKIVRMNHVAERLTGWKFEEAVGQPLPEVFKIVNGNTRKEVENPVDRHGIPDCRQRRAYHGRRRLCQGRCSCIQGRDRGIQTTANPEGVGGKTPCAF